MLPQIEWSPGVTPEERRRFYDICYEIVNEWKANRPATPEEQEEMDANAAMAFNYIEQIEAQMKRSV